MSAEDSTLAGALSDFGRSLSKRSGIGELMEDLGAAMAAGEGICMMGGGNPARIPFMEQVWYRRMGELLAEGDAFGRMLANYESPQGRQGFVEAVASCLNAEFGWEVSSKNIAVTNGSQTAFFLLLNMFSGRTRSRARRRILFPLCPEYIGYADQAIEPAAFQSFRPEIALEGSHGFKYGVDFEHLEVDGQVGAICVSRPTNPTGNVLTDCEVDRLGQLAAQAGVPLILDNAYGAPFPGILYRNLQPVWNRNTVLVQSLSKLGLPGTRTGIVVAREEIIRAVSAANSVLSLANGNLGQALVEPLLRNGELLRLCRETIRPHYEQKRDRALKWLHDALDGRARYRVHRSEGAFFLWLWFHDLPVTARELYLRLKSRGVLVVPGPYFFFGLEAPWSHADECIRLTYAQGEADVQRGIGILADVVAEICG